MYTKASLPFNEDSRLKFLVDSISEMVWEADADGDITYANYNFYSYTGQDIGSDVSDTWQKLLHPEDTEAFLDAWHHSLKSKQPLGIEHRIREAASGKYKWFITRAMPFKQEDGTVERWYGTSTDIDSNKQNEQLLAINRSKDEFISIASHQLRTPATGVKQYLGMLLEGMFGELSDTQIDILTRAYDSNERQIRIISDLLKVAQIDAGELRLHQMTTDISELVHYLIQDMSDTFKNRSQNLEYRPYKGKALSYVDSETMRMVVENLIDNASKYSPEDTTITVAVRRRQDVVQIKISDEGVGISPKDRSRLFERFSRIENPLSTKVGGTGLGLYWAHKVVDLHHGSIEYTPNKPQGSIFTIYLPVEDETVTNITEK
jgi:PAS domain S-box-containing protein